MICRIGIAIMAGNGAAMEAFLAHIGLSFTDLFAGTAGGAVAGLLTSGSKPNPWAIFTSTVIGMLTGGYLGPSAPTYIGAKPSAGASFIVGLSGTPLCRALIAGVQRLRWAPPSIKPGE